MKLIEGKKYKLGFPVGAIMNSNKAVDDFVKELIEKQEQAAHINYDLLERVLRDLNGIKEGAFDSEDVAYFPEKFNFTQEEFNTLFESLDIYVGGRDASPFFDHSNEFPDSRIYFEYKGYKFIWRLLVGQGSSCQLYDAKKEHEDWPSKKFPMKWDESRKIVILEENDATNEEG